MVYSAVPAACYTDGYGFESQASTNVFGHVCQYVDQKGSAAMLTSIQSAGESEVNLRLTQVRKHEKDLPWLGNPGQTSPEVQKKGIRSPTKKTYVPKIFFKKFYLGRALSTGWKSSLANL